MMQAEIYVQAGAFGLYVHCDIYREIEDESQRSTIVRPLRHIVDISSDIGIWCAISLMIEKTMGAYLKHDRAAADALVDSIEAVASEMVNGRA